MHYFLSFILCSPWCGCRAVACYCFFPNRRPSPSKWTIFCYSVLRTIASELVHLIGIIIPYWITFPCNCTSLEQFYCPICDVAWWQSGRHIASVNHIERNVLLLSCSPHALPFACPLNATFALLFFSSSFFCEVCCIQCGNGKNFQRHRLQQTSAKKRL